MPAIAAKSARAVPQPSKPAENESGEQDEIDMARPVKDEGFG